MQSSLEELKFTATKKNKIMKKLLSLIAMIVLGASTTFAQTSVAVSTSKQSPKKVVAVKTETKKLEVNTVAAKATAPVVIKTEVKKGTTTASSAKLKANGTPDMRYAKNKAKKPLVAGPTKKDGTADMRYKENKPVNKTKS